MADLSKIKLNGVTYNFKDTGARTAIGNLTSFNVEIISSFPASPDLHTIYFKQKTGTNNDTYDEYMYINNTWELIGSTAVDLSGYLQTTDIANWAKASTKPTYTANEVGALPNTYTAPVTSVNGQTGVVNLTIPAATTVTQTLTSGTKIGEVNSTSLYAPSSYDDTALAARVTAVENIPWVTYYSGTSAPSSAQGSNGDIYLQTEE